MYGVPLPQSDELTSQQEIENMTFNINLQLQPWKLFFGANNKDILDRHRTFTINNQRIYAKLMTKLHSILFSSTIDMGYWSNFLPQSLWLSFHTLGDFLDIIEQLRYLQDCWDWVHLTKTENNENSESWRNWFNYIYIYIYIILLKNIYTGLYIYIYSLMRY